MECHMNAIRNIYVFKFYENKDKKIENRMMEWRDESDGIKDNGRMMKNQYIR